MTQDSKVDICLNCPSRSLPEGAFKLLSGNAVKSSLTAGKAYRVDDLGNPVCVHPSRLKMSRTDNKENLVIAVERLTSVVALETWILEALKKYPSDDYQLVLDALFDEAQESGISDNDFAEACRVVIKNLAA